MSYTKPPMDVALASRTAELLALPQMVCRRRDCRRRNKCFWRFTAIREPCCLRNLTPEQRRVFDAVYLEARGALHCLGRFDMMFLSPQPFYREYENAAVEIARNMRNWDYKRWNAAWRKRERLMAEESGRG